jgi:hypothetical protein
MTSQPYLVICLLVPLMDCIGQIGFGIIYIKARMGQIDKNEKYFFTYFGVIKEVKLNHAFYGACAGLFKI